MSQVDYKGALLRLIEQMRASGLFACRYPAGGDAVRETNQGGTSNRSREAPPQAAHTGDLFGDSVRGLTHTLPATLVVS
jgi:hypothetical protein